MNLRNLTHYYHTLKYLQPKQIIGRFWGEQKRRFGWYSLPELPTDLHGRLIPKIPYLEYDPWNTTRQLEQGNFNFLNHLVRLGWPVRWETSNQSLLWRFNLHYFNYLYLLPPKKQLEICLRWIKGGQGKDKVAMHPYPTSLRIVNWCKAGIDHSLIYKSLYRQAAYLSRNTEFFHPGNHYLENARALIFAGRYFQGQGESARWIAQGLDIFRRELPNQILSDGGYFERSPMYHAIVLVCILDLINILHRDDQRSKFFSEYAEKMTGFLESLTLPDGTLPLYNDATTEIAPPPLEILDYANSVDSIIPHKDTIFPESGYYLYRDSNIYMTIDGGAIGPDYLPAHAHADIFSYQISFRGKQFIVDSGVHGYNLDAMRDYVRGTRAHNTVCIDKLNQAEVWDSFRVAKRYKPYEVEYSHNGDSAQFSGSFDGYSKLIGDEIIHSRKIAIHGKEISIEDNINGTGKHLVESLIHLHPKVRVQQTSNGFLLQQGEILCSLEYDGVGLGIENGWYCPEFGKKIPNRVIVFYNNGTELPVKIQYAFRLL